MRAELIAALATIPVIANTGTSYGRDLEFETLATAKVGYNTTLLIRIVDPDTKCEYIGMTEGNDRPQYEFNVTGLTPRMARDGKQICQPEDAPK